MGKISTVIMLKGTAHMAHREDLPTKVTYLSMVLGFSGGVEISFLKYKALRTRTIQNIGLVFVAALAAYCKDSLGLNSDSIWNTTYLLVSFIPLLTNRVFMNTAPKLAEVVACLSGISAGLIACTRVTSSMFESDTILLFWVIHTVLVQMRSVCVVINRLAGLCSHLSLQLALGVPFIPALLRTMYMTVVTAAIGVGMDHFYRKEFLHCIHSRKANTKGLMQGSCSSHYHASIPTAAPHVEPNAQIEVVYKPEAAPPVAPQIEATPLAEVASKYGGTTVRRAPYCPALKREATNMSGLAGVITSAVSSADSDVDDDCMLEWDLNTRMRGHSLDHTPEDIISSLTEDEADALPIAIDQIQNLHRDFSAQSTASSSPSAFIGSYNLGGLGLAQVNVTVPWAKQSDLPAGLWGRVESGFCRDEIYIRGLSIRNPDASQQTGEVI